MTQRNGINVRSNDELARLLHQRESRKQEAPDQEKSKITPPALASRRDPFSAGNQSWSLGATEPGCHPVTEREHRALFVALNKGSKANLGHEPTVADLLFLVEKVNAARELAASAQGAISGGLSVYIENGNLIFRGSTFATHMPARTSSNAA